VGSSGGRDQQAHQSQHAAPPRSQIVGEFRRGLLTVTDVQQIRGHIHEFAMDAVGCKLLLQLLDSSPESAKVLVFAEVMAHSLAVMQDSSGHIIAERLLEIAPNDAV
jgi:hypothetical protein